MIGNLPGMWYFLSVIAENRTRKSRYWLERHSLPHPPSATFFMEKISQSDQIFITPALRLYIHSPTRTSPGSIPAGTFVRAHGDQ